MTTLEIRNALIAARKALKHAPLVLGDSARAQAEVADNRLKDVIADLHPAGVYRVCYRCKFYAAQLPHEEVNQWFLAGLAASVTADVLSDITYLGPINPTEAA